MENCVLLKVVPHPNLLPSKRAFTPVFDGLCGEKERSGASINGFASTKQKSPAVSSGAL